MEIKTARSTFTDTLDKIKLVDNGEIYGVECCGQPLELIYHKRYREFMRCAYNCPCGNYISVRTKKDKKRWFSR